MSFSTKLTFVLLLSSFLIHASLAMMVCEDLPKEVCAFSIDSYGKRCLLETYRGINGKIEYQCKTSEVVVDKITEYIETDQCVKACGVDRNSIGISSDSFFEPKFTSKLCSSNCYDKCPNIVDLFFNMAAGEGVFLPELCEKHKTNPRRAMVELVSSGTAFGPTSSVSEDIVLAPTPAPAPAAPIAKIPEDEASRLKRIFCKNFNLSHSLVFPICG